MDGERLYITGENQKARQAWEAATRVASLRILSKNWPELTFFSAKEGKASIYRAGKKCKGSIPKNIETKDPLLAAEIAGLSNLYVVNNYKEMLPLCHANNLINYEYNSKTPSWLWRSRTFRKQPCAKGDNIYANKIEPIPEDRGIISQKEMKEILEEIIKQRLKPELSKQEKDEIILEIIIIGARSNKNYGIIEYIPEEFNSAEICWAALKKDWQKDWLFFPFIPAKFKTAEMCRYAVEGASFLLPSVPDKFKTKELCLAAVKKSGWTLEHVPEHLKTEEMCLVVVKDYGMALEYVPEKWRKKEMCQAAIQNSLFGMAIKYVPESVKKAGL
uniref:DUF4116 domain-containing protein n=1 Tax=uncultured bacterium contig00046 TaxID=1181532 RepID=A0A806KB28_9BACT|nr:hypothetical protein [uncultured bacterium contig00046]